VHSILECILLEANDRTGKLEPGVPSSVGRLKHMVGACPPSGYGTLGDSVFEVMPLFDKTMLKAVDTADPGTVDSSLQHAPDS